MSLSAIPFNIWTCISNEEVLRQLEADAAKAIALIEKLFPKELIQKTILD